MIRVAMMCADAEAECLRGDLTAHKIKISPPHPSPSEKAGVMPLAQSIDQADTSAGVLIDGLRPAKN